MSDLPIHVDTSWMGTVELKVSVGGTASGLPRGRAGSNNHSLTLPTSSFNDEPTSGGVLSHASECKASEVE
ncbi:hypothetical protein KTE48_04825 [Burkholderia gladioli]|nr:hypothetical protein [Burkholderia gladioli]